MHRLSNLLFILLLITGCQSRSNESGASEPAEAGGNELLEKEVWKIHDEVMPKMGTLIKTKNKLKEQLDAGTDLTEERKKDLRQLINECDNAYDGMMDWMHQFKPEEHADDDETAREYLEMEMEKVKKVRQDILDALRKGGEAAG
jgi:hypothetical protein